MKEISASFPAPHAGGRYEEPPNEPPPHTIACESLFKLFKEVSSNPLAPENRTYLPFNAKNPDRKIDYIFYGGPIELLSSKVLTEASDISDHLPIEITFRLTTSE